MYYVTVTWLDAENNPQQRRTQVKAASIYNAIALIVNDPGSFSPNDSEVTTIEVE